MSALQGRAGRSLGNSDEEGGAVLQLKHALNLALAEGLAADDGGAVVVVEGARQNLAGGGTSPIHQDGQRRVSIHCLALVQHHPLQASAHPSPSLNSQLQLLCRSLLKQVAVTSGMDVNADVMQSSNTRVALSAGSKPEEMCLLHGAVAHLWHCLPQEDSSFASNLTTCTVAMYLRQRSR